MAADKKQSGDLKAVRERIDRIDAEIQKLISERASVAQDVRAAKGEQMATIEYYRPEREAQVLRGVKKRNQGPLSDEEMVRLFREIMSSCLAQQEPLKIAFLGPEGTFTQQAVLKHFGHAIRSLPLATIEEVFREVEEGVADFGVVPVENSTEGSVQNTLDMFLTSPLKICGEVELRIRQNLMARGLERDSIRRVFAHPQSFAQCRQWLRENLPDAEKLPVPSNAEAARRVQESTDAAAIGAEAAAEIYGLKVMERDIEDQPDNTTRFLVIGRFLFSPSGKDKTSLLLAADDRPGLLYGLLQPLAGSGINMTKIESRPSKRGRWKYVFFIDVEGHVEDAALSESLEQLGPVADRLKVLGSYPVAEL